MNNEIEDQAAILRNVRDILNACDCGNGHILGITEGVYKLRARYWDAKVRIATLERELAEAKRLLLE